MWTAPGWSKTIKKRPPHHSTVRGGSHSTIHVGRYQLWASACYAACRTCAGSISQKGSPGLLAVVAATRWKELQLNDSLVAAD